MKFLSLVLVMLICLAAACGNCAERRKPLEIIGRVNSNFQKIQDASADVTLNLSLLLLGCSGNRKLTGRACFRAPDQILGEVYDNKFKYFVKGNNIKKIDDKGRRFYLKLLYAPDCSPGFNPGVIPHNFDLSTLKDAQDEIVLMGIPKPGILKNVTKVFFYIDPQEYILRAFDVKFINQNLLGLIKIHYEKRGQLWVPVGFEGRSAIANNQNFLIGIEFKVESRNLVINQGLSDKIFDPGF